MTGVAIRPPAGFRVGHCEDAAALTGCTVVLCGPEGAAAAVSQRGPAPGTRETDLLRPGNLVERVHAVVFSGGSAFGLDAACGVADFLEEAGIGFPTPYARVPIVCSAVIYDLGLGDSKVRPRASWGEAACRAAGDGPIGEGNVGAGAGAAVGKVLGMANATKAGVGAASVELPGGGTVAALAVANCYGEIVEPRSGSILAGLRVGGELRACEPVLLSAGARPIVLGNTALVCVMTDLALGRSDLARVAEQANDGLARAVRPCHTAYDGDTIFTLSSGRIALRGEPVQVGVAAVDAVSRALVRAATEACGAGGLPSHRDLRTGPAI